MAGNKKKKKAVANPARGYATSSVASKPKPDLADQVHEVTGVKDTAISTLTVQARASHVATDATVDHDDSIEPQSADAYEAQLLRDELQILVEKHGDKVFRERDRSVSKLQTERKVLRAQALKLDIMDWASEEILDGVYEKARQESVALAFSERSGHTERLLSEEDLTIKLWTLELILSGLGIATDRVDWVVAKALDSTPKIDTRSQVWGLPEALSLLPLTFDDGEMGDYQRESINSLAPKELLEDHSGTETPRSMDSESGYGGRPESSEPSTGDDSDSDSAYDPDDLLQVYLSTMQSLFDIDPSLAASHPSQPSTNTKKSRKVPTPQAPVTTRLATKLQRRCQKIGSDVLFDRLEADRLWAEKRLQLIKQTAADRRQQANDQPSPKVAIPIREKSTSPTREPLPPPAINDSSIEPSQQETSDDDLLGGIFSVVEEPDSTLTAINGKPDGNTIHLRDFGNQSGLSPRRVLEEACRARDSKAKITFKMISDTTFASRHSVTIAWSKAQSDQLTHGNLPSVGVSLTTNVSSFAMTQVATVDSRQSEAFIATVALFSIFSESPKESKVYLRLPPSWRQLWAEFVHIKKDATDSAHRDSIQRVRGKVSQYLEGNTDHANKTQKSGTQRAAPIDTKAFAAKSTDVSPAKGDPALRELWLSRSSSETFQFMLKSRMQLPMFSFRDFVVNTISQNQVTILCGETGCGKSTQLPSFIMENELSQGNQCLIYCTQPRRISAISLARRVSQELGETRNDRNKRSLVGYAIRLENTVTAFTRLVFATVGVVLRMLESAKGIENITHLVIDEVHERSIETDFLLVVLQKLMVERPDLKIVLMSATVDAERFSSYLNAPVINVPGRTFPVATKFLEDAIVFTNHKIDPNLQQATHHEIDNIDATPPQDGLGQLAGSLKNDGYDAATISSVLQYDEYQIDYELISKIIHGLSSSQSYSRYNNAILVFLPGMAEIRRLNDVLLGDPSFQKGWLVYPLHSSIASDEQQQVFATPPPGMRKIVLATNIAETGITIPDITCVIDTGQHREMRFDERRKLSRLIQSFISRANAKQRRGRAGRVQEGLCFHLFTKYRHEHMMMDQQTPEMLRLSLQEIIMRVKTCKLGNIEKTLAKALDPPSPKNIRRAIDALVEVDALTSSEDLTALGRQLAKIPLDAHLGKLVLLGSLFKSVDFAVTVAAILSSRSPFETPMNARRAAEAARLEFSRGDSDLLTDYNAYCAWRRVCGTPGSSEFQFCKSNYLSSQTLANIEELKGQLLSCIVDAGFVQMSPTERGALRPHRSSSRQQPFVSVPPDYDANKDNDQLACALLAWALYPKVLIRAGKGWRTIANSQSVFLSDSSVAKKSIPRIPTSADPKVSPISFLSYYNILQVSTTSSRNNSLQAFSASVAHALPLLLMAGEADFKMYAGVISLDGGRLKFAVKNWRTMIGLRSLRRRTREIVAARLREPGKPLGEALVPWMELLQRIFDHAALIRRHSSGGMKR